MFLCVCVLHHFSYDFLMLYVAVCKYGPKVRYAVVWALGNCWDNNISPHFLATAKYLKRSKTASLCIYNSSDEISQTHLERREVE